MHVKALIAYLLLSSSLSAQIEVTEVTHPSLSTLDVNGIAIGTSGETLIFGGDQIFTFDGDVTAEFTCDPCYEISALVSYQDTQYLANNFGGIYKRVEDSVLYLAGHDAGALAVDKNGILYGNDYGNGFFRWNGTEAQHWNEDNSALPTDWVYDIDVDTNGLVWLATQMGLVSFNGSSFSQKPVPNELSSTFYDLIIDDKNAVWVSSAYGGVGRFANNTWTTFPQTFNLLQLVQDVGLLFGEEIWTASFDRGVYRYRNNQFVNYTPSDLGYDELESCSFVIGDAQGRIWMRCNNTPLFYIITEQTSVNELPAASTLTVAPNPASDEINFSVALDQPAFAAIDIYTAEGRLRFTTIVSSVHQVSVPVDSFTPGLYLATVRDTEGNRMTKPVVIK